MSIRSDMHRFRNYIGRCGKQIIIHIPSEVMLDAVVLSCSNSSAPKNKVRMKVILIRSAVASMYSC